jgi:hypothetical protein
VPAQLGARRGGPPAIRLPAAHAAVPGHWAGPGGPGPGPCDDAGVQLPAVDGLGEVVVHAGGEALEGEGEEKG